MSELKPCEYCERVPVESLDVVSVYDGTWFFDLNGPNIRFFDDEYPGVLTHIGINYCPMCGKPLSQAARETRRAGWVKCSERLPEPPEEDE